MTELFIIGVAPSEITAMSNDELMFWSDVTGKNLETIRKWR